MASFKDGLRDTYNMQTREIIALDFYDVLAHDNLTTLKKSRAQINIVPDRWLPNQSIAKPLIVFKRGYAKELPKSVVHQKVEFFWEYFLRICTSFHPRLLIRC